MRFALLFRLSGRLLVIAGCLSLGACTKVGPEFARPAVPWLETWSGSAAQPKDEKQVGQKRQDTDTWWRNFNDPIFDALVVEAQQRNPGVRTAGMRIMEARAQLGIAGSALYPQLQQLHGDALRAGRQQSNGPDTDFWTYNVGLDVAWEQDFWGKFRRGIEAERVLDSIGVSEAALYPSIALVGSVGSRLVRTMPAQQAVNSSGRH